MKVIEYRQGSPSWFELETSDETAAGHFYGALFGWRDDPQPMGDPGDAIYHMETIDNDSVAAITRLQPDHAQRGIPPHRNTYITLKDINAIAAKIPPLGGAVLAEPFDVMDVGRMAVITDPTGAPVALWQARAHIGSQRIREPNTPPGRSTLSITRSAPPPSSATSSTSASIRYPRARTDRPTGCSWPAMKTARASSRSRPRWARRPTCGWCTSRSPMPMPSPRRRAPSAGPSSIHRSMSPASAASQSSKTRRAPSSAS